MPEQGSEEKFFGKIGEKVEDVKRDIRREGLLKNLEGQTTTGEEVSRMLEEAKSFGKEVSKEVKGSGTGVGRFIRRTYSRIIGQR